MTIPQKLLNLQARDLTLRATLIQKGQLGEGYHPEMAQLHKENAVALDAIITDIGYPTISKVGEKANAAAWLVIQHAIGQPKFMKKCAKLLAQAVSANEADPKHLAYLTDRIAVFEGKPQHYGTSFDWDQHGQLSPNTYDNLMKVNQRRAAIGLNSLEEQTEIIRSQALNENQLPPENLAERNQAQSEWRKKVGWIK